MHKKTKKMNACWIRSDNASPYIVRCTSRFDSSNCSSKRTPQVHRVDFWAERFTEKIQKPIVDTVASTVRKRATEASRMAPVHPITGDLVATKGAAGDLRDVRPTGSHREGEIQWRWRGWKRRRSSPRRGGKKRGQMLRGVCRRTWTTTPIEVRDVGKC